MGLEHREDPPTILLVLSKLQLIGHVLLYQHLKSGREFNLGDLKHPAISVRRKFIFSQRLSCREVDFNLVQGRPFLSVRAKHQWVGVHPLGSGDLPVPGNVQTQHPGASWAEPHTSKLPSGFEVLESINEFFHIATIAMKE